MASISELSGPSVGSARTPFTTSSAFAKKLVKPSSRWLIA
jgi:hypothetical protein